MSLLDTVNRAVLAAVKPVRPFFKEVQWTFVSSSVGSYDPTTDSYATSSSTKTIPVLPYDDKDEDDQMMFSSRGNFIETPTRLDTLKVLLVDNDLGGSKPSVNDYFMWEGVKYLIDVNERVPGDSIYIMRASRA